MQKLKVTMFAQRKFAICGALIGSFRAENTRGGSAPRVTQIATVGAPQKAGTPRRVAKVNAKYEK